MRIKRLAALLAAVLVPAAFGTQAAGKNGSPQNQPASKAAAKSAAPGDAPIFKVGDRVATEKELEALLRQDLKNEHMKSYRPLVPDFDRLLGQRVDREALLAEARRRGLDRKVEKGVFRLQRNYVIFKDFLRNNLAPSIKVEPAEVDSRMPKELRYFTIRQIVLSSREEADACLQELTAGADFGAMIQERSMSPESRKEGVLWRYRAGDGVYSEEVESYLFSLPLGVYSRVFEIGTGFAVARIEKAEEPPEGTREKLRAKIERRLATSRFDKERDRILDSAAYTVMTRESLAPLVRDWVQAGKVSDAVVVEVPGDGIRFSEMVALEKLIPRRPGDQGPEDMLKKFLAMGKSLAAEHIIAREAERRKHVLSEAARKELETMLADQMLEMLYAEQVGDGVALTPAEVRAYYDKNVESLAAEESVEVRQILLDDEARAGAVLEEIRKGKDFQQAARECLPAGAAPESAGVAMVVRRGATPQEFEAAAFSLQKPGDLAGPVRTAAGWHLIQLVERKAPSRPQFDEVKGQIEQMLLNERRSTARDGFLKELRKKVTYFDRNLASFRERFIKTHMASQAAPALAPRPHGAP